MRLAAAVCEKRLRICNRYNIAKTYLATKIATRHKRREITTVLPCRTDKEHKTGVFQKQVSHICRSVKKRGSLVDFRVYRFLQVSFKIFGACLNEIVDFFRRKRTLTEPCKVVNILDCLILVFTVVKRIYAFNKRV